LQPYSQFAAAEAQGLRNTVSGNVAEMQERFLGCSRLNVVLDGSSLRFSRFKSTERRRLPRHL